MRILHVFVDVRVLQRQFFLKLEKPAVSYHCFDRFQVPGAPSALLQLVSATMVP